MARIPVHITIEGTTWRGFLLPADDRHPARLLNIILNSDWRGNLTYADQWIAERVPELSAVLGDIVDRWYRQSPEDVFSLHRSVQL